MEPTGAKKATSLIEARVMLLSLMPLMATSHEVVDTQRSSFNEGLQHFHAEEYHKAIELFHIADGMQENNLILFSMSFTYYLIGNYEKARMYADHIDVASFGPDLIPGTAEIENLYFLIDAQAASWEEQEDNYRKCGGLAKLYIASDIWQSICGKS